MSVDSLAMHANVAIMATEAADMHNAFNLNEGYFDAVTHFPQHKEYDRFTEKHRTKGKK